MDRLARVMEYFWLVLGVVSSIWMGVQAYQLGWGTAKVYVWFPMVCFAMYFYRRFMRKKMAAWAERKAREQEKP